jgi:xanthine dehydrogenase accessory factor
MTARPAHPDTLDSTCAVAHGAPDPRPRAERTLVAVFASPVAEYLLHYGVDLGFAPVLVEPDAAKAAAFAAGHPSFTVTGEFAGLDGGLAGVADVVATDHHRPELGMLLRDALAAPVRWIGVLGNPHHPGPHREMLRELGVEPAEIDRVHRPIGLNIGSRSPAEIAVATLAGLLADRNGRPGGFEF